MGRTSSNRRSRAATDALRRCFAAVGFIAVFVALCFTATTGAASWAVAAIVGTCCALPAGAVVTLELVPALSGLRMPPVQRDAIRSLRRDLDALPETSHPLDA